MTDQQIIPECYIDTNLLETLIPTSWGYNHSKGCPAVAKKMQEKFPDTFALGIMDNDKRKVQYLNQFQPIADDGTIFVYRHNSRPHYIILITPAAEEFILAAARELQINLSDYDIPTTLEGIKQETKQIDARSSQKYRRLFRALRPATECQRLIQLVTYLKQNPYTSNLDTIQSFLTEI